VTGPPTVPYSTPPPAASEQEPENRARALVIAAIVGLLALAGVVAFLLTRDGDDGETSSNIPAATEEPTGLGDDEGFNALAQDCYDGDMQACDDLYNRAEDDSAYRSYGDTCAGRQPAGTRQFCTVAFPDD
jgi:hypothetical protein